MTKANYAAWHVNSNEFSENWDDIQKLCFFGRYAILAPSGHNTQPWHFSSRGQTLLLKADFNRRLPYSGIQANEPYVSLGACLGVLQLAAKGFGYNVSIDYVLEDTTIATIKIAKKVTAEPSLLKAIIHRVSNRSYYDTENLPKSLLSKLVESELKDVSTQLISKKEDIAFVAEQTTRSTLATFSDKEFRVELSKWVRNNVTKQHDGMPGFAQGIPTPISLFARHIIKRMDVSKDQAKKDSNRVLHSADLVVVTIHNSSESALLDGGRAYAQICVRAQQQNIATTGVGAAIIDPTTKEKIVKKFKLPGQPIAIIRLGRTVKRARHTPRWPFSKVMDS